MLDFNKEKNMCNPKTLPFFHPADYPLLPVSKILPFLRFTRVSGVTPEDNHQNIHLTTILPSRRQPSND